MSSIGSKGRLALQNNFLEKLGKKFDGSISNFVLGNAQEDLRFPIVYCSDGFSSLTGYSRNEIMGRSCDCSFLYGPDTVCQETAKVYTSFATSCELKTEIVLYKKSGVSFRCLLDVMPIQDEAGKVVLFLVSHKEIFKENINSENRADDSSGMSRSSAKNSMPRLRKFSRDVLFHLHRQYQGDSDEKASQNKGRRFRDRSSSIVATETTFIPQYKLEETKVPPLMLLHFGRARLIWDWLILFIVAYIAITIPFMVAFGKHEHYKSLVFLDIIFEIVFIMDILINFRTTYLDKVSGRLVTQPSKIALHYIRGWFVLDLMAAIPFELLFLYKQSWGSLISLLKCGRLLRLFRVARRVGHYIEHTTALLILMMSSFVILAHWLACIWYAIGHNEVSKGNRIGWLNFIGDQTNSVARNRTFNVGPSHGEAYISALYFVMTSLTTVGFGNIAPNTVSEKCFSVIILLLGAMVQSAIFGNMTAVIQKLYAARARFHAKASQIKQFARLHRLDGDLQRRIEDWFVTDWSITKGVNTEEMLSSFPKELQADICLHLYRSFLSLPCFANASRGCLRALSLRVSRGHFGPGEVMIKEKDAINCLFYVQRGTIEIVQKGCIVAILGSGDIFGENISAMKNIRRANGDVRALMHTEVLFVTREGLREVLKSYPEFAQEFSRTLQLTFDLSNRKRLSENPNKSNPVLQSIDEEVGEVNLKLILSSDSECTDSESNESEDLLSPTHVPLWQSHIQHPDVDMDLNLDRPEDGCGVKQRSLKLESRSKEEIKNVDAKRSFGDSQLEKQSPVHDYLNESDTSPLLPESHCDTKHLSIMETLTRESTRMRNLKQNGCFHRLSEPLPECGRVLPTNPEKPCTYTSLMYVNPNFSTNDQNPMVDDCFAVIDPATNREVQKEFILDREDCLRKISEKARDIVNDFQERSATADINVYAKCGWRKSLDTSKASFPCLPRNSRCQHSRARNDKAYSLDGTHMNHKLDLTGSVAHSSEDFNIFLRKNGVNYQCANARLAKANTPVSNKNSGSHAFLSESVIKPIRDGKLNISVPFSDQPANDSPVACNSEPLATGMIPELISDVTEAANSAYTGISSTKQTHASSLSRQERKTSRSDGNLSNIYGHGLGSIGKVEQQLSDAMRGLVREILQAKFELKEVQNNLCNIDDEIEAIRKSLTVITVLVRDIADEKS